MERAVCYQIESRCVSGARERRISRSFKDNALALGFRAYARLSTAFRGVFFARQLLNLVKLLIELTHPLQIG